MSKRTTNQRIGHAAAVELAERDDVRKCRRRRLQMAYRLRRQLAPHLITAAILIAGLGVDLVAFLVGSPLATTLIVLGATSGAVGLTAIAAGSRIPARHRGRLLAAGITGSGWLTLITQAGITWDTIAALMIAEQVIAAGHWRAVRIGYPAPEANTDPAADAEADENEPVSPAASPAATARELDRFEGLWETRVATNASKGVKDSILVGGHHDGVAYAWIAQLEHGDTLTTVRSRTRSIASLLGIRADNLLFDDLPLEQGEVGDDSRILVQIVTASPVCEAVPYEVPTVPDGLMPIGPYVDGRSSGVLPIVTRKSAHSTVVIGSSGVGKTSTTNGLVVSIRKNIPTVTLYMDPKGNSSPDLRKHATVALLGLDEAELFTRAVERLCEGRGYEHGLNDLSGFTASIDHPLYLVVVDECDMLYGLPGMGKRWGTIRKTGRALGVVNLDATQYGGTKAFGNDEMLRSNTTNVVLMRTESNTSDRLIAPGLPPSRFLPRQPGYAYLRAEGARRMALRAMVLRSSDDAEPGADHAGLLLERYPDVEVDAVGRVALGELLVPREQREAETRKSVERKYLAFLAGPSAPDAATAVADNGDGYGEIIKFRPALKLAPSAQTAASRILTELRRRGVARTSVLAKELGLPESTVSQTLKRHSEKGLAVRTEDGWADPSSAEGVAS